MKSLMRKTKAKTANDGNDNDEKEEKEEEAPTVYEWDVQQAMAVRKDQYRA